MTRFLTLAIHLPSLRPGDFLARIVEADRCYRQAKHLRDLPEHMLDDIGLTRRQADRLAREVQSGASM